jgi:hypothetical protein
VKRDEVTVRKDPSGSDMNESNHRKIIATEFGPLGGSTAFSFSWRDARAVDELSLLAMEGEEGAVVVFRLGGTLPG